MADGLDEGWISRRQVKWPVCLHYFYETSRLARMHVSSPVFPWKASLFSPSPIGTWPSSPSHPVCIIGRVRMGVGGSGGCCGATSLPSASLSTCVTTRMVAHGSHAMARTGPLPAPCSCSSLVVVSIPSLSTALRSVLIRFPSNTYLHTS